MEDQTSGSDSVERVSARITRSQQLCSLAVELTRTSELRVLRHTKRDTAAVVPTPRSANPTETAGVDDPGELYRRSRLSVEHRAGDDRDQLPSSRPGLADVNGRELPPAHLRAAEVGSCSSRRNA